MDEKMNYQEYLQCPEVKELNKIRDVIMSEGLKDGFCQNYNLNGDGTGTRSCPGFNIFGSRCMLNQECEHAEDLKKYFEYLKKVPKRIGQLGKEDWFEYTR